MVDVPAGSAELLGSLSRGLPGPATPGTQPGLGLAMVDLTLTISENLPASWATHMPFQAKVWNWFRDEDGVAPLRSGCGPYFTRWLLLDEHIGTHFDAPSHFLDPGLHDAPQTAEAVPLERFQGQLAIIRAPWREYPAEPGCSGQIGPGGIEAWENTHGRLSSGHVVVFATGWDEHYTAGTADRYCKDVIVTGREPGWPAPSVEVVEMLSGRGVACLGTDAPSMGPAEDGRGVHVAGLGRGMAFVEGLAGLSRLPDAGSYFAFFPIKVHGGSGAPGRAIAITDRRVAGQ
jgi:kynurenine formamidase